jgi:hypothetical protein
MGSCSRLGNTVNLFVAVLVQASPSMILASSIVDDNMQRTLRDYGKALAINNMK